jgi:hypothetical protein
MNRENPTGKAQQEQQQGVMKKYGLRWAVLAAWWEDLSKRSASLSENVMGKLEVARTKIASGCFSVCEVGCDLGDIEATLTSIDASLSEKRTDHWIGLLATAMADEVDTIALLKIPAVKFHYNDCKLRGCHCER